MRLTEFTNEGMDPGAKAAIKGMRQLSGDQYYGLYKTMKDVAGHDGEKQTAPDGKSDHEVSDKPFAYAYTDEEKNMIKGVDPKAKQITSDKSEELDEGSEEDYKTQRMWDQHDDDTEDLGIVGQGEHWAGIRRNKQRRLDKEQQKKGVSEAGRSYDDNRTGFSRGPRDDERHDLDVARPLIYGLKINGKIWQKDGNTVTFFTKERALAARNSILAKRPELEVGLVQRPQD
jgi:hypothetical protein